MNRDGRLVEVAPFSTELEPGDLLLQTASFQPDLM